MSFFLSDGKYLIKVSSWVPPDYISLILIQDLGLDIELEIFCIFVIDDHSYTLIFRQNFLTIKFPNEIAIADCKCFVNKVRFFNEDASVGANLIRVLKSKHKPLIDLVEPLW